MVNGALILHRVTLVVREEVGPDGFGWPIQWLAELFYADDVILTSPRTDRIQAVLYVLAGLSDRVVIQTNVDKTVGMVFQTQYIFGGKSETAYTRWMMGVVPSFQ